MISIIIPIFNAEEFLEDCLNSIKAQTYSDFEVLCVNDGSNDGSEKICKCFSASDSRFIYIRQLNLGVSAARNKGLDEAKGDYVCFVDADDLIAPSFLEMLLIHASNKDLVICDYTRNYSKLGQGGGVNILSPHNLIHDIVFEQIKHPNIVCFLYKRNIIEKNRIRFTIGCVRNEDYEFYMRYLVACIEQVCLIGYIGYYYRINNNSAMARMTSKSLTSLEATERIASLLEETGHVVNKEIIIANGVLSFLYRSAVSGSSDLYNCVHSYYDANISMKRMLRFPVLKKKIVAVIYLIIGKRLFYKLLSKHI